MNHSFLTSPSPMCTNAPVSLNARTQVPVFKIIHRLISRNLTALTILALCIIAITIPIHSVYGQPNNYYVGGANASDVNEGTSALPFATVQKAATMAVTGSVVNIRAGTYRETITPANSGVTFQPDGGAAVVISGLNEAGNTGWTVHSGNIYKKTITLNGGNDYIDNNNTNTTLMANQLFKDGVMQIEARWPNVGTVEELFDRTKVRQRNSTVSWNGTQINDAGIPAINWTGGKIWITGWYVARTASVTAHSGNTITYSPGLGNDDTSLKFLQYYYLTGKLAGLDIAKEWFYDKTTSTLYFWQNGGGSPTGVEYKARNWGFDVRGKTDFVIKGITFIGCEPVQADVNSLRTIVDGIRATYTNHTFLLTGGGDLYTNVRRTGSQIIGAGSVLKNSEFKYCASQMVWAGQACRVENNLFEYGNYEGNYGSFVNFWNPNKSANQVVTRNTMRYNGRSAIDFSEWEGAFGVGLQEHLNMDISYNDISHSLMLSSDGGQTYGSVYTNLTGLRLHHNWIHDSDGRVTPTTAHVIGLNAGIYWDQATGPSCMDHNVLWNNYHADIHTQQSSDKRNAGKSWLINNTFATGPGNFHYAQVSYLTLTTNVYDYQRNNIYIDEIVVNYNIIPNNGTPPGNVSNSIRHGVELGSTGVDPLFEGGSTFPVAGGVWPAGGLVTNPEAYFQLKVASPGVNTGTTIPSSVVIPNIPNNAVLTEDAVSTPDIGAYERGGSAWVPGYVPVPPAGSTVATPAFNPAGGTYTSSQSVAITSATTGAEIRYTIDGSIPTASSTLYTAAVSVPTTTTLKAIGIKSGMTNSAVATALYTINLSGATVNDAVTGTGQNQFEYVGTGWASGANTGAYLNDEHYSQTTNDYYQVDFTGTQIQVYTQKFNSSGIAAYSIDGGTETNVDHYNSTLLLNTLIYTSPTLTNGSHTLKVRVTGTKNASSSSYWLVADRVVIVTESPVSTPVFNPVAGTYTSVQSVAITTSTSGAEIRYTIDGSTPTASSILYTSPVDVSATTTLKAIGIKSGLTNSAVATALYTIPNTTAVNNTITGTGQNQFEYVGTGWVSGASAGAYLNDEHYSQTTNDYYQVDFTGTQIHVYAQKFTTSGIAAYSIDNGPETNVDHYNSTLLLNTLVYASTVLTDGSHTLKARVTGTRNANSSGNWLVADRIVITEAMQVATPTFNPPGGPYSAAQSVTITTITPGAEIRYTTDGNTPTASSTLYAGPVNISGTTTLKAIGIKSGKTNSQVATAVYTFPSTITINNTITGTGQNQFAYGGTGWASGASTGAYLNDEHYSQTTNDYYQVAFTGTQIQVYSQKFNTSGIAAYSIDNGTETNVDHYNSTLLLNTLTYTSLPLTDGIHTLKVRVTGTKNVSSSNYWLVADRVVITEGTQVATPTFNPAEATYSSAQSVTITTTTPGAEIRYTTNGSTPTATSTLYTGPVNISATTTLKALGIKSGKTNSAVATAVYTIITLTTINNTVTGTGQNQFEYVGTGWISGASTGAYLNDEHYSLTTNSYYQVDFIGTQIQVYSQKFNSSGIAAYSIDGGTEMNVDHYNSTLLLNTLVYTSPPLSNGNHTLKVRVTGTHNASSSNYWLVADRVVITSEGSGGGGMRMSLESGLSNESVIYPNPSTGNFYINNKYDISTVEIYNVSDGKTYTLKNTNQERIKEIDVSTFSDGVYLLKLFNGKEFFFVKIIKKN